MKIGIVGKGFVGGSVAHGFNKDVEQIIVDPRYTKTTLAECVEQNPTLIFICLPTPESDFGAVDVSIIDKVLVDIDAMGYDGIVVIKSTITPDYLGKFLVDHSLRIVYNPEFLTEANAHDDFCNPPMQVLGGQLDDCDIVDKAYLTNSSVNECMVYKVDIATASLIKYTLNSWLATKVIFMNELFELHKETQTNSSWEQFTTMLTSDKRMGNSHMKVPGPDGSLGFGGHCFPKDTAAFLAYSDSMGVDMGLLEYAVYKNAIIRDL
jgi:UDPglucose 6-dehydrogenase|tara:strand:+ start:8175 stop:8969 length:795 start_codon:yes stop_codon:yes gene_type:complete